MNYLFVPLLFVAVSVFGQRSQESTPASKKVTRYLNEYCSLIKKNALYADSIDWKELESKITTLSAGASSIDECKPVIDTIMKTLKRAGDRHSFFLPKEAAQMEKSEHYEGKQPESTYINDGIGYVKIPEFTSFNTTAATAFASTIQSQIRSLDEGHAVNAWIVDLRGNTGGNMYPMMAGVGPLLPEGVYGYIIDPRHEKEIPMVLGKGQAGNVKVTTPYKIKNPSCKIAVLINATTGSSGEFTAISFLSLPNVRTFGQPSAGATTSNHTYPLSDGAYLMLATAYMADRNHTKYLPNIVPNVLTPAQTNSNSDPAMEAAIKWLQAK